MPLKNLPTRYQCDIGVQMLNNDIAVDWWLVKCENIIREDKDFQFHWKLIVSKLCYELALECEWIAFMQACMQYDDPQFKLTIK